MAASYSITTTSILLIFLLSTFISTEAYDPLDPNGNITIKWDIMTWTEDGYVANVKVYNYQQYRHIESPGWRLSWVWGKEEVIWNILGAQAMDQGDCSEYRGIIPHCCIRNPSIIDLLPGTPYNMQVANCCRGGVISSMNQDPSTAISRFQLTVGASSWSFREYKSHYKGAEELHTSWTWAWIYLWACTSCKAQQIYQARWKACHSCLNDLDCQLHIFSMGI